MSVVQTITKMINGKTVCGICGKDVNNAPCLKEMDSVFDDLDKVFAKLNRLFRRWKP